MKIIHPGHPKDKAYPWPVGSRFNCPQCGCEFQVEKDDRVPITAENHPGGRYTAHISCPSCATRTEFDRPRIVTMYDTPAD